MKKTITYSMLAKGMSIFLLVLMSGIVLSQAVPEYMYFKFDAAGNQQNYASAPVGTNPAVLTGLTTGSTGQFSTALVGNGLASGTNNLSTGWATNMPATGWTISFWLNNFPATAATTYYYFGDATGATFRCFTGGVAGNGNLWLRGTGLTDVPINAIPATPTVIHLVYTGSAIKVFMNGVLNSTVAEPSINITGTGPFLVGGYGTSNSFSAGTLMDEFRMYNRALPDAEVASTWNVGLPAGSPTTGTLSGTVTNNTTGVPIAGATITVGALNATSAANGTYTLANVPVGVQSAVCSATGFVTKTQSVTIVASTTTTQNFALVPTGTTTTVTVGSGTVSCNYPYTTFWMGGRTQLLYTAAQITAAGGTPGLITSLGFDVTSFSNQTMIGFNVNLMNTTNTTIASWVTTGMSNAYTGTYAVPGIGFQMITLTTPFNWNGQNLLVEVCFGNNGSYTSYSYVNGTTAPAGQIMPYWMDNTVGCTYTGAPNTGYTGLPNLRFVETPISGGTLTGTVTNSVGGAAIAGATVTVNTMTPVTTNAAGLYSVTNITPATVNVTCTKSGFVPYAGTAVITSGSVTTLNIAMVPNPKINGTVTDASTGAPVVGATVTIDLPSPTNPPVTMTIGGGIIPLTTLNLAGVHNFYINKTGYDQFVGSVTLTGGNTSTITAALLPTAVPPGPFTAALNNPTTPTAVNLNWGIPQGMYQIIYDDGGEENFAIWATANNLNALKFTPLSWPVKLIGGKVNLGMSTDYPANALPFTAFTMLAYKADGPGGVPGTKIDSVTVTPTDFGWADFSFTVPLTINSGDFYLVMKQGGIPPHAAGVAVDLTNTQLRSYSKFVTGGGPWVPAAGNFMMRAIVQGLGGPMDMAVANKNPITASAPEGLIYQSPVATVTGYEGTADYPAITPTYQVWRLQQGQEGTPASWVSIWTGATNTTVDNGWPSLACGPYRWAVEAIYSPPGQRFSAPTFSNVLGKCWTANVNVCVALTCAANAKAGTIIKLVNTAYPDTNYTKATDTSGCVHFTNVWKGSYTLTATRFTYPVYTQTIAVNGDVNLTITLLQ
ncbi:MAG: carboxypeptidase regulatory-like domain-containing protein, partial [Bacteroidota bacterium]